MKTFFSIILAVAVSIGTVRAGHDGRGGHDGHDGRSGHGGHGGQADDGGYHGVDTADITADILARYRREADTSSAETGRHSAAANREHTVTGAAANGAAANGAAVTGAAATGAAVTGAAVTGAAVTDSSFIGGFGYPYYWNWALSWGWGIPYAFNYGYYSYGYYPSYSTGLVIRTTGIGYSSWGWGVPYAFNYGYQSYGYNRSYGMIMITYSDPAYSYGYADRSSIAQLQSRLARAGYYYGAIDGIMGPQTRRAIRAL